jgi:hypothetical protein
MDSGAEYRTTTDHQGNYRMESLPEGQYTIVATLATGEQMTLDPVRITSTSMASSTSAAGPAQVQATVTIETQAPLVETSKSHLNKYFETLPIWELPGRRTLDSLAVLKPGVVENKGAILSESNSALALNGAGFSVNGTRPTMNYFTLDGGYNMDPVRERAIHTPAPETMQAFEMTTSNFPAQFGHKPGSIVNQITRTGTNGLHGTLMYTWNGNSFDALSSNERRTFDALRGAGLSEEDAWRRSRSVVVAHKALVGVGFPIWRDRVFSFSNWDHDWFHSTVQPQMLALSPQGLLNLQGAGAQFAPGALNFLTQTFPTANEPVSRGQFAFVNPTTGAVVIAPLQQFNPAADAGGARYERNSTRVLQKIDARITDANSLSLRYFVDDMRDPGVPTSIVGQQIGDFHRHHSGMLNDVHVFSPNFLNEFRFTYNHIRARFPEDLGLGLNIGGFNSLGNANFPQSRRDNSFQFADNFTWTMPHHSVRLGVDAINYRLNSSLPMNSRGTLFFPSLTDFLLNQNAVFSQFTGETHITERTTTLGAFIQDDIKFNRNLAINIGIRYENGSVPAGFFQGVRRDTNNWAPRFGFAWSPDAGGMLFEKTVIRGGYAIVYDQMLNYELLPLMANNFPRGVNLTVGPVSGFDFFGGTLPPAVSPDLFTGNPAFLPRTTIALDEDGRMKTPYMQQFMLGMEREFLRDFVFRAYYVGSKGTNLYRMVETNPGFTAAAVAGNPALSTAFGLQPVLDPFTGSAVFRQNPALGSVLSLEPIGNSIYNSGQFSVVKRYSAGIQLEANYTYSSYISDSDNILSLPSNPFDLRADRARSIYDQPHRFAANYIFRIPDFIDDGLMSRVLSGWQLSGVTRIGSGTPFSLVNGANALGMLPTAFPGQVETSQRITFNASGIPGTATGIGIGNPMFVFNPANSGIVGNVGRNTLRTARLSQTDLALVKGTKTFSEDQSLQLRLEVFNVFNRKRGVGLPFNLVTSSTDAFRLLNGNEVEAPGRSLLITARYFF